MRMNKKDIWIIIGLLLLTAGVTGCTLNQIEPGGNDFLLTAEDDNPIDMENREPEPTELTISPIEEYQEPPASVTFNSIDDYISFVQSPRLSKDEFFRFLSDEYTMNGINDKKTVEEILEWIKFMPFPYSSDYLFTQMIIYPTREEGAVS